jgi:hypothetical protein
MHISWGPEKQKKEKRNRPGDTCPLGRRKNKQNKNKTKNAQEKLVSWPVPSSLVVSPPPYLL